MYSKLCKMLGLKIDPSTYVLKFGKYKNMLAVNIVDIQTINKKESMRPLD